MLGFLLKIIGPMHKFVPLQFLELKGKSLDKRKTQWLNHFKSFVGSADISASIGEIDPISPIAKIVDIAFTLDEAVEAREQVKEDKAPVGGEIMPEVLKRINIDDIILHFVNKILLENKTPEPFFTLNLLPIPKFGDLRLTTNYRGIALTSLVANVNNYKILNHIRPILDPELRGNQSGFRPGRSTTT